MYSDQNIVEDTQLITRTAVHIKPTLFLAKMNTRTKNDFPNVLGFSEGPHKEKYDPIEIEDILKFDADKKGRKVVLIEGTPGSGKSTTARYLCRLWAEDRIGQEYKLFIVIHSAHSGREVLFLFEGWDERPQNCAIVHEIINGQELPASSIIITSRYNSAGQLYEKICRRIEVAPFPLPTGLPILKSTLTAAKRNLIPLLASFLTIQIWKACALTL